jgi:hypothetical protein
LWFTENQANKVGRITTAGNITEYTLPTADNSPNSITTGPDGNLWLTAPGVSSLAIDKLYLVARRTGASAPGIYYFRNRTGVWVTQHVSGTVASDTSPSIAVDAFAATPRPQLAFVRTSGVYTSSATTGNFRPRATRSPAPIRAHIAIDSNGVNAYLAYGT